MTNLNDLGMDFQLSHLEQSDLEQSPVAQFDKWMQEAIQSDVADANAMVLSTVDDESLVSSRVVLLKFYDDNGLVFFTNYNSPKAKAIATHPQAAGLFWWPQFERQVRVQGHVSKISEKYSDEYFQVRSKDSNIAATISKQSEVLTNKQAFYDAYEQLKQEVESQENIQRPNYWGGFCLSIDSIEFWQGGNHRMHDRFKYVKSDSGWQINRLYP